MKSGYITSGSQQLHYLEWGHGKQVLLCFHGYGNQAGLFASLANQLLDDYTILSFDLPYHGNSRWNGNQPWQQSELVTMVQSILQERQVPKVSLLCFSIGGRIGLTLAGLMPEQVDRLVLLAPDGLTSNAFYSFVTRNPAGKRLFAHFLNKPDGYIKLMDWLQQNKMLDATKKSFITHYISSPSARMMLKNVWPNLRLIVPQQGKVKRAINKYKIPTHLFMGRYDQVIPLKNAYVFAKGVPGIKVHVLEKGHRLLDDAKVIDDIVQILRVR